MSLNGSILGTIAVLAIAARGTPPRSERTEMAAPCGSQAELSARVEILTGLPPGEVAAAIDGWQVTAHDEGYQVDVRVALPRGEHRRRFRAESCGDALDASALILAMALTQVATSEAPGGDTVVLLLPDPPQADPALEARPPLPDEAPADLGQSADSSAPVPRPARNVSNAEARPPWRPWLAASLAPSLGSLFARATPGMHGDVAVGLRFLRVAAAADIWFPRKLDAPGEAGARGYGGRLRGWQLGG
ncbi:MAG: hypothetical protein JKY37_08415, partial [Nannocystaceae bacterium]|nr:hypothetical protein [Nannocystaceae bacterium]